MFEQDYVMRLIKEMVRAILKLLFNIDTDSPSAELLEDAKEQQTLDELLDMVDNGFINEAENKIYEITETSVYKGYKRDKIEMRVDRVEVSDFPLYLNTVAGGLDRRDQTIGGFSFVVKIYAVPVVEIIGQLLYLLGRYGFNTQFGDCL